MNIIINRSAEVPDTNTFYFDLHEFSDNSDILLFQGYNSIRDALNYPNNRKVLLQVYMPTEYNQHYLYDNVKPTEAEDIFEKVYSICPYTCSWLNTIKQKNMYKAICYPFNEKYIPKSFDKKYDVCYHGGIHGPEMSQCLSKIKKFNYRYMSLTYGINGLTAQHLPYATNLNLSNIQKLQVVAETKISVCYNFVYLQEEHKNILKSNNRWDENIAWSEVDTSGIEPQIKSRFIEAAFCKSLNLVRRDNWNVVEHWFEPNKHFIYFNDENDLEIKIEEILNNWDSYAGVLEDAFNKAKQYSIQSVIKQIEKDMN